MPGRYSRGPSSSVGGRRSHGRLLRGNYTLACPNYELSIQRKGRRILLEPNTYYTKKVRGIHNTERSEAKVLMEECQEMMLEGEAMGLCLIIQCLIFTLKMVESK